MQRVVIALFTLATVVGCKSASDQLCEKNVECQGDEDPAATCAEQTQECEEDEDCKAGRDVCKAESDALAACILSAEAESECQGIGEVSFYLPTADGACENELDTFLACQDDN
jgi:hypothetical protein